MTEPEPVMKQHVSILGALYIAFGVLGLLAAFAMLVIFGGLAGAISMFAHNEPDAAVAAPILGVIAVVLFFFIAVMSIPGIAVGIGLVKFQSWARIGGLILSALNLMNFPFGTALGAYGLWVLLNKETEPLFT